MKNRKTPKLKPGVNVRKPVKNAITAKMFVALSHRIQAIPRYAPRLVSTLLLIETQVHSSTKCGLAMCMSSSNCGPSVNINADSTFHHTGLCTALAFFAPFPRMSCALLIWLVWEGSVMLQHGEKQSSPFKRLPRKHPCIAPCDLYARLQSNVKEKQPFLSYHTYCFCCPEMSQKWKPCDETFPREVILSIALPSTSPIAPSSDLLRVPLPRHSLPTSSAEHYPCSYVPFSSLSPRIRRPWPLRRSLQTRKTS